MVFFRSSKGPLAHLMYNKGPSEGLHGRSEVLKSFPTIEGLYTGFQKQETFKVPFSTKRLSRGSLEGLSSIENLQKVLHIPKNLFFNFLFPKIAKKTMVLVRSLKGPLNNLVYIKDLQRVFQLFRSLANTSKYNSPSNKPLVMEDPLKVLWPTMVSQKVVHLENFEQIFLSQIGLFNGFLPQVWKIKRLRKTVKEKNYDFPQIFRRLSQIPSLYKGPLEGLQVLQDS